MHKYVAHRLAATIPMLLAVSMLTFALVNVIPGDVVTVLLGEDLPPEVIEQTRQNLGLDRPIHVRYFEWLGNMLRADFGESYVNGVPVGPELLRRMPVTLELTVLALIMTLVVAIPAGTIAALKQDTWFDYSARLLTVGGLSVPSFWLGLLFLLLPVIWWGWSPNLIYKPLWEDPLHNMRQFMLPAIALAVNNAAIVTRMVRSSLIEVLRSDYVRTARAKGLRERAVVTRHAFRNAFIPVMTILGLQLGTLLGGTVVLENVFSLPGIGRYAFSSIGSRDFLVLQTIMLMFAFTNALVNLMTDITYAWLDPRIRYA